MRFDRDKCSPVPQAMIFCFVGHPFFLSPISSSCDHSKSRTQHCVVYLEETSALESMAPAADPATAAAAAAAAAAAGGDGTATGTERPAPWLPLYSLSWSSSSSWQRILDDDQRREGCMRGGDQELSLVRLFLLLVVGAGGSRCSW